MRVLLISLYSDITSFGLRTVSACAGREGHEISMLFLPHTPQEESRISDRDFSFPDRILTHIIDLAQGYELAGISLMTNYLHRARVVSTAIRDHAKIPVVWGGIHPTLRPFDAAGFADYVIRGEGEMAFCELIHALKEKNDTAGIRNLVVFKNGRPEEHPPRPLELNLDVLPFPDYGPDNHLIWDRDAKDIVPMTDDLLHKHLMMGPISRIRGFVTYQTMATRGCPHRCAYCCNDSLQELYTGQKHLRRRSDQNVLAELQFMKTRFPFIEGIGFSDDSFFATGDREIEVFADLYKSRINLPFFCLGSPLTISERKINALIDAGMYGLQMGVQTGSPRIQEIYNRRIPNNRILEAVHLLHKFSDRMVPPAYDFIVDSPWETQEDIIQTLQLIRQFPRPYRLQLFSLVIFPETGLYRKAVEDHLIDPNAALFEKEYHSRSGTYTNLIMGMYRYGFWKPLLDILSHPAAVRFLDRPAFNFIFDRVYRISSFILRKIRT